MAASLAFGFLVSAAPVSARVSPGQGPALPFASFYQMEVDGTGHVFVSGGPSAGGVAVMSFAGDRLETLSIPGASGMALHGTTLYIASNTDSEIAVVDTSTNPPAVTGQLPLSPAYTAPTELDFSGGRLWFVATALGDVGPSVGTVKTDGSDIADGGIPTGRFVFATSSSAPNLLLGSDSTQVLGYMTFDTSTVPATLSGSGAGGAADVAISPDGTHFLALPNSICDITTFSCSYAGGGFGAEAGAFSPSGQVAVASGGSGSSTVSILDGSGTAIGSLSVPGVVPARGVAWSPDGSSIFAVSQELDRGEQFLFVLHASQTTSSIYIKSVPEVFYGVRFSITGHVTGGSAGDPLFLYAAPLKLGTSTVDGPSVYVEQTTLGAGGAYSFDVIPNESSISYEAVFPGSATAPPAASATWYTVNDNVVGVFRGGYGTSGAYSLYHTGGKLLYHVAVDPPHPGSLVEMTLYYLRSGGWHLLGSWKLQLAANSSRTTWFVLKNWPSGIRAKICANLGPTKTDPGGGTCGLFKVTG